MSAFSGAQGKGALARHRAQKRQQAHQRAEHRLVAENLVTLADEARGAAEPAPARVHRRATAPVTSPGRAS